MNTQRTKRAAFDEAFALLQRVQDLLLSARVKHEQRLGEQQKLAA